MSEQLLISAITVGKRRRHRNDVTELSESIARLGLLHPITVTTEHRLIAGFHRLEACRALGWTEIPAVVLSCDALDAELAEIDENLIRNDLTVLERSEHLARRKAIYEARHPETKAGGDHGNQFTGGKPRQTETISVCQPSFADDAATNLWYPGPRDIPANVMPKPIPPQAPRTLAQAPAPRIRQLGLDLE